VVLEGETDDGDAATFGPATLVRAGASGNVFSTSFPQLPVGTWTPTVTGPANHYGSHVGTATAVTGGSATITMTVAEREVRLRASAPPTTSAEARIAVVVGPDDFTLERTVAAGASDTVVYVPATQISASVTPPTGWGGTTIVAGTSPGSIATVTAEL